MVVVVRGLVVVVDELAPVVGGRVVVLVVVLGGPVVVVVVVVVLRPRRRRLATSASLAAWPWQTARPSPLQRPSMLLRHARERPPAATHAAISSWHACRHCRATDAASAELAACNVASSVSSSVDPRAFSRRRISQPPRASSRRTPGRSVAGEPVQASILPHALWTPRGAQENVDVEPPFGRPGSRHSRSSSPAASTRRRSRWVRGPHVAGCLADRKVRALTP